MALITYTPDPVFVYNIIGDSFSILDFEVVKNITSINSLDYVSADDVGQVDLTFEVRYTTNNIDWTEWISKTEFLSFAVDEFKHYKIEFRLTQTTSVNLPPITVTSVQLDVTYSTNDVTYFSIFGSQNLFSEIVRGELLIEEYKENQWQKCNKPGTISEPIERTPSFEGFWKSVSEWMALHYFLSYQFSNIYDNKELLSLLLEEKGLFLCGDETLEELQNLSDNFYREISKRGTSSYVDEFKRLICYDEDNEYISFTTGLHSGWLLDRSSPMHNFYGKFAMANKLPVKTDSVSNEQLALYSQGPSDPNKIALTVVSENTYELGVIDVMNFSTTDVNQFRQIRIDIANDSDLLIPCDQSLDYYMSFFIKTDTNVLDFSVGIDAFEEDKVTTSAFRWTKLIASAELSGAGNGNFFMGEANSYFGVSKVDKWVWFMGIIRNENTPDQISKDTTNLNVGSNMSFNPNENARWMYPILKVKQNAIGTPETFIHRLRVGVLSNDNFTLNYLDLTNFLYNQVKINSSRDIDSVQKILDRYLLPASMPNKTFTI